MREEIYCFNFDHASPAPPLTRLSRGAGSPPSPLGRGRPGHEDG